MAVTAEQVVSQIRANFGPAWKDSGVDAIMAGSGNTPVTGIATTFAPSLDVLRKAAASGRNLVISRESPFWARHPAQLRQLPGAPSPVIPPMDDDLTYQAKRKFIADNGLVVFRLVENWNARPTDGQLIGLSRALGWDRYYAPTRGTRWARGNGFFNLPPSTLMGTAQTIKARLGAKSLRIGGKPSQKVTRAALTHGMYWLDDLHAMLAEPGVDLIVVGEPQWENELSQYSFDLADAGLNKGMIVLGQAVSEDPGGAVMADWLKSFIKNVPVQWIPTGEPSWTASMARTA